VPGAVERLLVDLLPVLGHVVANLLGQLADAVVRHGGLLSGPGTPMLSGRGLIAGEGAVMRPFTALSRAGRPTWKRRHAGAVSGVRRARLRPSPERHPRRTSGQ